MLDSSIMLIPRLVIIAQVLSDSIQSQFANYIIKFPQIKPDQLREYVYTVGKGLDPSDLEIFLNKV